MMVRAQAKDGGDTQQGKKIGLKLNLISKILHAPSIDNCVNKLEFTLQDSLNFCEVSQWKL